MLFLLAELLGTWHVIAPKGFVRMGASPA
jgi:hypothetical protein